MFAQLLGKAHRRVPIRPITSRKQTLKQQHDDQIQNVVPIRAISNQHSALNMYDLTGTEYERTKSNAHNPTANRPTAHSSAGH